MGVAVVKARHDQLVSCVMDLSPWSQQFFRNRTFTDLLDPVPLYGYIALERERTDAVKDPVPL